ncbi:MAG: monovalent cation/H(+) antiporter subunit G [Lachnospiraceae bacterium]|nr:monovalent cation/H(+) antiporter subunit G [Lachnospiraceae bacterium]
MMIAIYILIGISLLFAFAGVVGMLRMPDSYSRMQSSTNIATLGVLGVIIGGILYSACILKDANMAIKLGVMGVFYIVTAPISGHAIAKAAYAHGIKPCENTVCDQLKEDLEDEA